MGWSGQAIARQLGCNKSGVWHWLTRFGVEGVGSGCPVDLDDRYPLAVLIARQDGGAGTRMAGDLARQFLDHPAPYVATDGRDTVSLTSAAEVAAYVAEHLVVTVVPVHALAPWAGDLLDAVLAERPVVRA